MLLFRAFDHLKNLPDNLKQALGDPTKLFSLSDKDFASIDLDVLSNLPVRCMCSMFIANCQSEGIARDTLRD